MVKKIGQFGVQSFRKGACFARMRRRAHGDGRRGRTRAVAVGSEKEGTRSEKVRAIPRRKLSRRQWRPFFLTSPFLPLVVLIAVWYSDAIYGAGIAGRKGHGARGRDSDGVCCAHRDSSGEITIRKLRRQ